ncbi:hypothetical protein [Bradyrhizobium sp. WSM2793]|nr:hypothetical protein [Bradyrhizobium sp. WSM2793]
MDEIVAETKNQSFEKVLGGCSKPRPECRLANPAHCPPPPSTSTALVPYA